MSVLSAINPTLMDVTKRLNPNGGIETDIVEILTAVNPILEDMPWKEGNLPTGHRSTIRTGLPDVTWRKLYGGVQPSKSRTAQVTDTCAMLEAYAEIDKALADLNGNTAAFRISEEKAFLEAFSQEFASKLFYGNEATTPEHFTGFAARYSSKSAENAENILSSASTPDNSDNTSIWLIGWGDNVHGIYPKGSRAGLSMTDKGQVTIENADGNGGRMEGYRTHYRWDCGLVVRDWRYCVRIQIDQEDLTKNASTGPDLIDLLAQATELLPSLANCRPVFYANRNVRSFLRRQIVNKVAASTLTADSVGGKQVLAFDGIPFRRTDALLNTETGF